MTSAEQWAEVLAIAAGPWKRDETRELASTVLEHLQVEVAEDTLRAARNQLNWELQRCIRDGEDSRALVRAMRRISMLKPETVINNKVRSRTVIPRREDSRELV